MSREPYSPPTVTQLDPEELLSGVLRNARKANQLVAEMDRMAESLQGKAEEFAAKVAELQGIVDSSVRDMRKLEAFRELEAQARSQK